MKCTYMRWLTTACLFGLPPLTASPLAQSPPLRKHVHFDVVIDGTGSRPLQRRTWADAAQAGRSGEVSTTPDNQILLELTPEDTTPANLFDLDGRTLVFRPDGRGGYWRDVRSLEWEETLGAEVTVGGKFQDGVEVEFGDFEFDYAGRRWNSVIVSKHGLLTFGAPLEYSKHFAAWFSSMSDSAARFVNTPTISALYKPAFGGLYGRDPLASQFVARFPDRVVVTWFASEYDAYRLDVPDDAERFQAVLYADGAIQFNYDHITVRDGVVGLFSDVVEKGNLIASVADVTDPDLPGHLDLLEVALYETGADTVILEFTTREPIPEPTVGFYNYRLFFDIDPPYSRDRSDRDLVWKIEIGGDHSVWGGVSRAGDRPNRIELLADIRDLQGVSALVFAAADEYDDSRSYVRGDRTAPVSLRLPTIAPVDLSEPDRGPSRLQSEVFHHLGLPAMTAIACRIIENLGDEFDLFIFHNEFRVDAQMNDSDWRNYYNGVRGIGREDTWRGPPCGDGRLLGHYEKVVRIGKAGGRSHDWRNGNFEPDVTLFAHEVTHSWTAYLSYFSSNGTRGHLFADSFADGCRCHWQGALHAPAAFPWGGEQADSLMTGGEGGGFWRDNGDGTFTAITDFGGASGLSWLDLYSMGLAEASEVRDLYVLHNVEPVPGNNRAGRNGRYYGTYHADKEIISVDHVVAAMGPREPPAARSRKELNTGFVYLLEPGQTPTSELLQLHKDYIDEVVEYWSHVTGGRSRIAVAVPGVANRPPVATGTLADQAMHVGGSAVTDVAGVFRDPDGDSLTYEATTSAPAVASVAVSGSTVTVRAAAAGTATVTVTATDIGGSNTTATLAFRVTVERVPLATFTDDPIRPGVTPIKAVHFTELRERIDLLRDGAGLGRFAWTDPILTAGVTPVRLSHLLELREALAAAYRASGRAGPAFSDVAPMSGMTPIRAVHLTELRAAVVALQ